LLKFIAEVSAYPSPTLYFHSSRQGRIVITRRFIANQSPAVGLSRRVGFGVAYAGRSQASWGIAKPCDAMSLNTHEGTPRMNHLVGGSA
jgi:hypothetical protein